MKHTDVNLNGVFKTKVCQVFLNIKWKEEEREQDSGETERVCERGRALQQEKDIVSHKTDC